MEKSKRAALFLGVIGGIILAMWVSMTPLVVISEVHPAEEQDWLIHGGFFPSDEDRRLAALSPQAYVEEITGGAVAEVSDASWQDIVNALRDHHGPAAWRIRSLGSLRPSMYFHSTEEPVRRISAVVDGNGPLKTYLRVLGDGKPALLRLRRHLVTLDDFHLGTGWADAVQPPSRLLFPARRFAPWLMLFGLALYFLIPGIRRGPETVRYSRRRLVLSDFVSVAMFGFFFGLPMLIPEGLQPALRYWPITLACWIMALPFYFILPMSARHAGWAVDVGDQELVLTSFSGREAIPFAGFVGQKPAVLQSPRWLRHLLWVGALLRPSPQTVGQALVLGGVLATGVELQLQDGTVRYIWASDALGNPALENGDILAAALERIPENEGDIAILQTFGMPLRGPHPA